MDTTTGSNSGSDQIIALIYTALYNTDGESVEGGFVDRWESYAGRAVDELAVIFRREGYTDADAAMLREELHKPDVPQEAAASFLIQLRQYTKPLVEELRHNPQPHVRALAVRAAGPLFAPTFWLDALHDADATVRLAAVKTLIEQRFHIPEAQEYFLRALADENIQVRLTAGPMIVFYKQPAAAETLVRHLESEREQKVRKALITSIAREVRSRGITASSRDVAESIGPQISALLLRELNNTDKDIRESVVLALDRLNGAEVANALLDRFLIERDDSIRYLLVRFRNYHEIAERSFPILSSLLVSDSSASIRTNIAFLMDTFGSRAVPPLIAALRDEFGPRRAAAMSLSSAGDSRALPALIRELANPQNRDLHRDLEFAITVITKARARSKTTLLSVELSEQIQRRIDALQPEGIAEWPTQFCQKQLNALPLYANSAHYMWAIRPDGNLLCLDLNRAAQNAESETDELTRFVVIIHGARRYPELDALVPPPPPGVTLCDRCKGMGCSITGEDCTHCNGLGWEVVKE